MSTKSISSLWHENLYCSICLFVFYTLYTTKKKTTRPIGMKLQIQTNLATNRIQAMSSLWSASHLLTVLHFLTDLTRYSEIREEFLPKAIIICLWILQQTNEGKFTLYNLGRKDQINFLGWKNMYMVPQLKRRHMYRHIILLCSLTLCLCIYALMDCTF